MQRRNAWLFFILSVLLFVMVVVIYWTSDSYSTFRIADVDFTVESNLDVSRIELISRPDSSVVVLYHDEQHRWRYNEGLYANEAAVNEMLEVLSRLVVWQPVSIAAGEQVNQMLEEQGVLVKIFVNTNHINFGKLHLFPHEMLYQSILVGPDAPDDESTYMKKPASERAFLVKRPGFKTGMSYIFEPNEKVWRDPVIIDAQWDEISQVEVSLPGNPAESYRVKNEQDKIFAFYQMQNGQQKSLTTALDTPSVKRFLSSFTEIYYESLLDEEAEKLRKEIMFEQPFMELTVELKDGNSIFLQAYPRKITQQGYDAADFIDRDPNRFYLRINEDEYALAQYYIFSRILRPLSFFENKKEDSSKD